MKFIDDFKYAIQDAFPSATVTIDAPDRDDGLWFIDVTIEKKFIVLQWKHNKHFGLSITSDFSCQPEETYDTADEVIARIRAIVRA